MSYTQIPKSASDDLIGFITKSTLCNFMYLRTIYDQKDHIHICKLTERNY